MAENFLELLKQLDKYSDKIVLSPISKSEIETLENELSITFPEVFVDYLKNIGLMQDLFQFLIYDYEFFTNKEDFLYGKECIKNTVEEQPEIYFSIAVDSCGNFLMMKDKSLNDISVYSVDHETCEITRLNKNFAELIEEHIRYAIDNYEKFKANADKEWHVQFCFSTFDDGKIIQTLKELFEINDPNTYQFVDKTPAGVSSYEKEFFINGKSFTLSKSIYNGWKTPHFYFDFQESALNLNSISYIKKMNELFKASDDLDYSLVDYGIFNKEEE